MTQSDEEAARQYAFPYGGFYKDGSPVAHELSDAFLAGIEHEREKHRWISVKERLPGVNEKSFIFTPNLSPKVAEATRMPDHPRVWWHRNDAIWCGLESVTHWMPLPEPPGEAE